MAALTDVVVLHVFLPVFLGQRRGKVDLLILLPRVLVERVVLGLGPRGVLHSGGRPPQRVGVDRRLAHRFGQVQPFQAHRVADVQGGELAGEGGEGDVEIDAQELAVQRAIDDERRLCLHAHVGAELRGQEEQNAERGGHGDGGARQRGLRQVTAGWRRAGVRGRWGGDTRRSRSGGWARQQSAGWVAWR